MPRATPAAALTLSLVLVGAVAADEERMMDCSVLRVSADGLYLDAGGDAGLAAGNEGTVRRGDEEIARIQVVQTSPSWALARVLTSVGEARPAAGDRASIRAAPAGGSSGPRGRPEAALKESPDDDENFVPLLDPPVERTLASAHASNIFHGQLSARQLYQHDLKGRQNAAISRAFTSGSLERLADSPWAAEWSGEVSYRDGEGLAGTNDLHELRVHVHRAVLQRKLGSESSIRIGRLLPRELPGVGYVDGVQGDVALGDHVHLGVVAGMKPDRATLALSGREPTVAPYLTVSGGERGKLYYSGTAGVLGSLYDGKPDRLALLVDQRLDLLRGLSLFCTTAVDLDVAMETRSGTRLSRLDAYGSYALSPSFAVRGGLDHHELPDTRATRDALRFEDDRRFDDGYWRYWAGASQVLPWAIVLGEEVGFIESETDDGGIHWLLNATRTGLPWLPDGSLALSVYNFQGTGTEGHGGSVAAGIPLLEHELLLDLGAVFRFLETESEPRDFRFTDVHGRVTWWISSSWQLDAGVSWAFGDDVERLLVDGGITFRW